MSTYAQVQDYLNYTDLDISTPTDGLQRLVDRAEHDVDRIIARGEYLTGAIMGYNIQGATGGSFQVQLTWLGIIYTSAPIMWNDQGADVVTALQAMTDTYGNPIPPDVWEQPQIKFYNQAWAYGPFPNIPIVVQAVNSLGMQRLTLPTVVNNTLIPTGTTPSISLIVQGGLKQNPYDLEANLSYILTQAVCAQAEYRDQMGEEFFARAQWASVSGPEFRTQGKLPYIGPRVMRELSGTDLLQRGARARPGTVTGRQQVYTPVGGTPIPDDWRMI